MTIFSAAGIALVISTLYVVVPSGQAKPSGTLSEAQSAVGNVAGVKALLLKGHARSLNLVNGEMSRPTAVEIRILLPAHYLRIENDGRTEKRAGFSGERLLNAWIALKPDVDVSASYGPDQIKTERTEYFRLLIGMLARPDAAPGAVVKSSGPSALELETKDGFRGTLDLDAATRLPVRLRYQGTVRLPVAPGEQMTGPPTGIPAEVTVEYTDRRVVSGVRLPHRITVRAKGHTLRELAFDEIVVNPPLTAKDFHR